jgi:cytochrome c553
LELIDDAARGWRADMIVTDGMQPWETCAACHSLDGISVMVRFPKLAGQRPDYIAKQVRDFRDGRRGDDGGQMVAIASEIGDDELAKTAAYFGGLPAPPPDASPEMETAEWRRGAALYQDGDAAAGGAGGASRDAALATTMPRPIGRAAHF